VEFYAAWCPHCRDTRGEWRKIARKLERVPVEVGAVNCVRQRRVCGEYVGVTKYPSVRMLNREFGTMQDFKGPLDAEEIPKWVEKIAAEWRWLFHSAYVHWGLNRSSFGPGGVVATSSAMWVVAFLDGRECPSCKAACTNLLRLSASLRGLPVEVGAVDCSLPEQRAFCYEDHGVPPPPHRPLVKAWRAGSKNLTESAEPGEVLYSPSDLEPHVAFMLVEKTVRLALADRLASDGVAQGGAGAYEGAPPEEDDQPPPPPPGGGAGWARAGASPELQWDDSGVADRRALPKPWVTWAGAKTGLLGR